MEIRTYFHLPAITHRLTFLLEFSPPTQPNNKAIAVNHFHSQQCSYYPWPYTLISQKQMTFLDTVEMGLTTDMQTFKSRNLL